MKKIITLPFAFLFSFSFSYSQLGVVDPTFGINGIVKTNAGSVFTYSNFGKQVLVQPDGSIYFVFEGAGLTLIAKKLPDGSADVTYGTNGYSVSAPIYGSHAAMQTDGKIVVAGYTLNSEQYFNTKDFAVARFNTNGSLDNTFDEDGIQVTDFSYVDVANSVAIQTDGKIVLAGFSDNTTSYEDIMDFALVRYNTDGSLDNTFDGDGKVTTDLGYDEEYANSVAIQSDGKIVVNGFAMVRYDGNGAVDAAFNGGGFQFVDFGPGGISNSLAIQSDGKIVAGGYRIEGENNDFAVARFNTDGTPDMTFDEDGIQTTDIAGSNDNANAIAIQNDGKIILGGTMWDGTNYNFAITRYSTDGSLDISFSRDGKLITDFSANADFGNSIAIQSDGKPLALGYTMNGSNTLIAASRYNTDGTPDNSFDGDGILTGQVIQGSTFFTAGAVQSDGKILATGYSWNGNDYDFTLIRYTTNGTLDNTFSGDGITMMDFGTSDDKARAIKIQADGKILVAGSAGGNFAIARYNKDGTPDNTFSGDGILTTDFGSSDSATSIALQTDGKIIAGGSALARYNTDGSLDVSFDGDGKLTTPFSSGDAFNCNDIAIQNDGKIVVTGKGAGSCIIARYNPNGSPDNTFADNGVQSIYLNDEDFALLLGKSIAIQNDGKIIIGGSREYNYRGVSSRFALIRLNPDGVQDDTFGNSGIVLTSAGNNYLDYGTSVLVQSDGKIILGGYSYNGSSDDFAIARYNADGTLDNTFGQEGIEVTQAGSAYDRIADIAIADDKLYATGYGQYPGNFGVIVRYLIATGGATPVTLSDFTATLQNKSVVLQWQTASEQNLASFTIERSADGYSFSPIDNVSAAGNSNSKLNYSTIDGKPLNGINFYRLKMIDTDGRFKYSNVVSVNVNAEIFTLQIFPNPATNILYVHASGENEKAEFQVIDAGGKKVKEGGITLNGNTSFSIYVNTLPKGTYNLQLHTKAKTETRRFIKQ